MTAAEPLGMSEAVNMVFKELEKNPESEISKSLYAQFLKQRSSGQAPRPETPPIPPLPPIQTTAPAPRISGLAEAATGSAGEKQLKLQGICLQHAPIALTSCSLSASAASASTIL